MQKTKTKKIQAYFIIEKRLVGVFDDEDVANAAMDKLKKESPDSRFEWTIDSEVVKNGFY